MRRVSPGPATSSFGALARALFAGRQHFRRPLFARTVLCFLASTGGIFGAENPASGLPAKAVAGPSFVLITVEGLRPDFLSCYARGRGKPTPNIDRLAAEGRLFEQVVTPSVSSLPSLATVLTGRTPFQHQVWDDDYRNRLDEAETTLAERLRAKGYRTAAFLGTSRAVAGRGFEQGFDIYQDGYVPPARGTWKLFLRSAKLVMPGARSWLVGIGEGPFFLWLHLVDPGVPAHGTATQPAGETPATYTERLSLLDAEIGRLLDLLKSRKDYESLVIVLTADHGFGLGEHSEPRSGLFLYEATLRVPLILRIGGKDAEKGKRHPELAGLIDFHPTVERLLGLASTPGLSGRNLLGATPPSAPAYQATALKGREVYGWAGREALAQGKWRLILGPDTELFDVAADPAQKKDLSASQPGEVARLKELSGVLAGGASIPPAHFLEGSAPPEPMGARLKQLNLTPPSLSKARSRPLPDPKRFKDSLPLLEEMLLRTEVIGFTALRQVREPLLQGDPEALFPLLGVGSLEIEGDAEARKRAAELLRTAQRVYPLEPEVYHSLGHLAFPEKRYGDAVFFLSTALEMRPRFPAEIVYDLACAHALNGERKNALARLKESVRLGFRDISHIQADPDLESVRSEPGFRKLVEEEFPSASTR